jgi:hypothetical protein
VENSKGKWLPATATASGRVILKKHLQETEPGNANWIHLAQKKKKMASCCEYDNEMSYSLKHGELRS